MDRHVVRKHKLASSDDSSLTEGASKGKKSHKHERAQSDDSRPSHKLCEVQGDLFSCHDSESLAHCISADARMGKGIAVLFKKKFGGVDEILTQAQKQGGVAVLERGKRYVYYLVTKEKYFHKPTYNSLQSSLTAMRDHCVSHGVTSISMPRIGCGLDGLQWPKVRNTIIQVFQDTDIKLTVYTL